VIGAATALLAQGANRAAPFYEFFHPHMLEPLTEHELLACLNALATKRGKAGVPVKAVLAREPERVRALYVLTGGNPRILGLVYGLLEQADSAEIFADLEALLDQVTPFYKARIEEYQTPLQRAVIDGIALNWDPITSNALSKQTGVAATTLSPQLDRLKKDGLIEEVETSGTRAGFQLAERFLNIWYLMRHGTRKTKQRLRWFTIFLTKLFNAEELEKMAGEARDGNGRWRADHCEAVIEAYELKMLSVAKEDAQSVRLIEILETVIKATKLVQAGQFVDGIVTIDELIAEFGKSDDSELQEWLTIALFSKGIALSLHGRSEEAVTLYGAVISRLGESDKTEL
jgi:predicted ArsR family transcriptional regulator